MATTKKPLRKPSMKAKKAFDKALDNGGNVSQAMKEAGYSAAMAKNPQKLKASEGWKYLMDKHLSDESLAKHHNQMLNAKSLDHLVFPLEGSDRETKSLQKAQAKLTDDDIIDMLAEEGCTVRRIVHGEQARHVYFWTNDNNSRKAALDMAYKLKGSYAAEKSVQLQVKVSESKKTKSNELIDSILGDQENSTE